MHCPGACSILCVDVVFITVADAAVTPDLHVTDSAHFHISSIRTLATYVTSSCVLIFSAGGRGQLCAWAADVISGSSVIGRLRWLANHTRRITRPRRKSANHEQSDQPDIRYMKVTTFSANDLDPDLPADLFILATACSDGLMRVMLFDLAARQFSDVAKSDFHGNCVLQVTHVICRSDAANQNSAIVFSAGTDGRICVWDVTHVVTSFCQKYSRRCQHSDNSASLTDFFVRSDKSFSSLTEADVKRQSLAESLQKTEANDTLASFDSTVDNADSSEITDASERLVMSHDYANNTICLEQTNARDRQAVFHRNFDESVISVKTKACDRQGSELEPCCVITAHQSGINSLAVRLRVSGALGFHHVDYFSTYLLTLFADLYIFVL